MAGLKEQLEAAGYDTAGMDEASLIGKLDQAGYDTTPLKGPAPEKGLMGKAWDALDVPRQKSAEGLQMIANAVPNPEPTGNLPLDIAKGAPKVAADTLAQVAPNFVDRTSLLTAGAGAAIKGVSKIPAVARGVEQGAAQLEQASGVAKGGLTEAFKDPSLITSPGTDSAGKAYEALKTAKVPPAIKTKVDVVTEALEKVKDGSITPQEAHKARKYAWALKGNKELDGESMMSAYDTFDNIVKEALPGADAAFKRAVMADSLRNVLPRTTTGKVAQLRAMGMAVNPKMWAFSPVVQGMGATAMGGLARGMGPMVNQLALPGAIEAYKRLMGDK